MSLPALDDDLLAMLLRLCDLPRFGYALALTCKRFRTAAIAILERPPRLPLPGQIAAFPSLLAFVLREARHIAPARDLVTARETVAILSRDDAAALRNLIEAGLRPPLFALPVIVGFNAPRCLAYALANLRPFERAVRHPAVNPPALEGRKAARITAENMRNWSLAFPTLDCYHLLEGNPPTKKAARFGRPRSNQALSPSPVEFAVRAGPLRVCFVLKKALAEAVREEPLAAVIRAACIYADDAATLGQSLAAASADAATRRMLLRSAARHGSFRCAELLLSALGHAAQALTNQEKKDLFRCASRRPGTFRTWLLGRLWNSEELAAQLEHEKTLTHLMQLGDIEALKFALPCARRLSADIVETAWRMRTPEIAQLVFDLGFGTVASFPPRLADAVPNQDEVGFVELWLRSGHPWSPNLCQFLFARKRRETAAHAASRGAARRYAYEHGCLCAVIKTFPAVKAGDAQLLRFALARGATLTSKGLAAIIRGDLVSLLNIALEAGAASPTAVRGEAEAAGAQRCLAALDLMLRVGGAARPPRAAAQAENAAGKSAHGGTRRSPSERSEMVNLLAVQ
jgi:hypothetical protein